MTTYKETLRCVDSKLVDSAQPSSSSVPPNTGEPGLLDPRYNSGNDHRIMVARFNGLSDLAKKSYITRATLHVCLNSPDGLLFDSVGITVCALTKPYPNVQTFVAANNNDICNGSTLHAVGGTSSDRIRWYTFDVTEQYAGRVAYNGFGIYPYASYSAGQKVSARIYGHARTDLTPYVEVEYEPSTYKILPTKCTPSGGTINKHQPNTFRWGVWPTKINTVAGKPAYTGPTIYNPSVMETQSSATFRWRDGPSGTIRTIPVSGTEQSVTVPGGTFTSDQIQWSVEVRLTNGQTLTSDWMTLSTLEVTSTAKAIRPDGGILDGTSPIDFAWEHVIATGTAPTGADIETGTNGTDFVQLAHITGADTQYTAPKNAFASGDVFWRVRTYNTDKKPGAWSNVAKFVVVGAPPAPPVRVDKVTPCPLVQWQSDTQQAYELSVNGESLGVVFGTGKSYRLRQPLPDGEAIIRVRVQNKFGLWSDWGSVSIRVKNAPGPAITLKALGGIEASLSWSTTGTYSAYAVLRDGVWIALVRDKHYIDRFVSGTCTYQIIGLVDEEGIHTVSNLDTIEITCPSPMICAVDEPSWISLALSASSSRQVQLQRRRDIRYVHYSGAALPSAEMGPAEDITYSFDVAWAHKDKAQADAFAALLGRLVCLKDAYGSAIIGILDGCSLSLNRFYRAYSCKITAVSYKEVLDDPRV